MRERETVCESQKDKITLLRETIAQLERQIAVNVEKSQLETTFFNEKMTELRNTLDKKQMEMEKLSTENQRLVEECEKLKHDNAQPKHDKVQPKQLYQSDYFDAPQQQQQQQPPQ